MNFVKMMIMPLTLLITLILLAKLTLLDSNHNFNKMSPFECGLDIHNISHSNFSTRFFNLTIVFLIFDIELVLLIPMGISKTSIHWINSILGLLFILILLVGVKYESFIGNLSWIK